MTIKSTTRRIITTVTDCPAVPGVRRRDRRRVSPPQDRSRMDRAFRKRLNVLAISIMLTLLVPSDALWTSSTCRSVHLGRPQFGVAPYFATSASTTATTTSLFAKNNEFKQNEGNPSFQVRLTTAMRDETSEAPPTMSTSSTIKGSSEHSKGNAEDGEDEATNDCISPEDTHEEVPTLVVMASSYDINQTASTFVDTINPTIGDESDTFVEPPIDTTNQPDHRHHSATSNKSDYWTRVCLMANAGHPEEAEDLLKEKVKEYLSFRDANTQDNAVDASNHNNITENSNLNGIEPLNFNVCDAVVRSWVKTRSPERAEAFLVQMVEWATHHNLNTQPTTSQFSHLLNSWAHSYKSDAAERAMAVLTYLRQNHEGPTELKPDVTCYKTVMHAYSRRGMPEEAEMVHAELFADYLKYDRPASLKPDFHSWSITLHAWSLQASKMPQAPHRSERIVARMCELYESGELPDCRPVVTTYNSIIRCWAKSDEEYSADRAESILRHLQKRSPTANADEHPDAFTYNLVLDAFAYAGLADRAEALVQEMSDRYENGTLAKPPDHRTFNVLLKTYARSDQPDAADRVDSILQSMRDLDVARDVVTYTTILDCWIRSDKRGVADRAILLLREMTEEGIKPDIIMYNVCMEAMAKEGLAQSALSLLKYTLQRFLEGDTALEPSTRFFNSLLNAWSKSDSHDAAQQAEDVLVWMEKLATKKGLNCRPNSISYNCVLLCWAKSNHPDAVKRAEALFSEMNAKYENGAPEMQPDVISYTTLMKCYRSSEQVEALLAVMLTKFRAGDVRATPDRMSFARVIDTLAESGHPDAPVRAQNITNMMREYHQEYSIDTKPNTNTYNSLLVAWIKSGHEDAGVHAHSIFLEMQARYLNGEMDVFPRYKTYTLVLQAMVNSKRADLGDTFIRDMHARYQNGDKFAQLTYHHFNMILEAWSQSSDNEAAKHAEDLLSFMWQLCQRDSLETRPSSKSYNYVMECWKNCRTEHSNATERADFFLEDMKMRHRQGNYLMRPTMSSYKIVIQTYSSNTTAASAERVEALLDEMLESSTAPASISLKPDAQAYNAILQTITSVDDLPRQWERAARVIKLMRENGVKPDAFTRRAVEKLTAKK